MVSIRSQEAGGLAVCCSTHPAMRTLAFGLIVVCSTALIRFHESLVAPTKQQDDMMSTIPPGPAVVTELKEIRHGVESVWKDLLEEGAARGASTNGTVVAIEVGMHRIHQCRQAAEAGLEAHCVEPSPTNFQRVKSGLARIKEEQVLSKIHLYNQAAGSVSNATVQFSSEGSTGDHVGCSDMWRMEQRENCSGDKNVAEVPTIRLDDMISNQIGDDKEVFVMKVDTQGFEPSVFAGLEQSLANHKVRFVLFEYWPRGIDLTAGTPDQCTAGELVKKFARAGYTLYTTPVQAHPKAPNDSTSREVQATRPLDDFQKNCEWYFEIEKKFPSDDYKMGYWSDIVAVAPLGPLDNAVTSTGKMLSSIPKAQET